MSKKHFVTRILDFVIYKCTAFLQFLSRQEQEGQLPVTSAMSAMDQLCQFILYNHLEIRRSILMVGDNFRQCLPVQVLNNCSKTLDFSEENYL